MGHGGDACMRAVLLFHDRRICWRRREFSWYTTATATKFAHAASSDTEDAFNLSLHSYRASPFPFLENWLASRDGVELGPSPKARRLDTVFFSPTRPEPDFFDLIL